jgi:DNA-binding transcriptional LysR family regulator
MPLPTGKRRLGTTGRRLDREYHEITPVGWPSFAGAAAELRHTPSAVSQQIAALERGVGVPLVERSTRGVTLTPAGELPVATADAVDAELQTAERQMHDLRTTGPQALTVATFTSAGETFLAPALTDAAMAGPDVDLTVVEAEPDDALAAVHSGEADLALIYHFHTRQPPSRWSLSAETGTYTPLLEDPLRLVVPAGHRAARRSAARLSELAGERWIHAWGETGSALDNLAATHGFDPRVACRSSDYRFMAALVAAGVGIALIPRLALTANPAVVDLSLSPQPTRFIGAYQRRRHRPHDAADRLLAALRRRGAMISASNP